MDGFPSCSLCVSSMVCFIYFYILHVYAVVPFPRAFNIFSHFTLKKNH